MSDTYHHGDLPAALRAATAELVAEAGPRGFSLREVARRAGVSHAAPAHHFGDSLGLLTAVSVEGFEYLADALTEAAEGRTDARDLLRALGVAYVTTALTYPGHYAVMVDATYHSPADAALHECGDRAFTQLVLAIEAIRDQYNPDLDVELAATLAWSLMHGLVELSPLRAEVAEMQGELPVVLTEQVAQLADLMIDGFRAR